MSENTSIEWADHTVNYWHGCTQISAGCKNCYAKSFDRRKLHDDQTHWGKGSARVEFLERAEKLVSHLNRKAEGLNFRPRVFVNSMSDWLDEEVPPYWLARLLLSILRAPNLDFLLLTKRPERFRDALTNASLSLHGREEREAILDLHHFVSHWFAGFVPENVWIGTTVEEQKEVHRVTTLSEIPAKLRFLSCEPLVAPLHLPFGDEFFLEEKIDWVIAGGESGPAARPMSEKWATDLRDQCLAFNIPFFFKQWGAWRPATGGDPTDKLYSFLDGSTPLIRTSKKEAGRLLRGQVWEQVPSL